MTEYWGELPL